MRGPRFGVCSLMLLGAGLVGLSRSGLFEAAGAGSDVQAVVIIADGPENQPDGPKASAREEVGAARSDSSCRTDDALVERQLRRIVETRRAFVTADCQQG